MWRRPSRQAAPGCIGMSVARGDEPLQRSNGRRINVAVDPLRPEMALERCHGIARRGIEMTGGGNAVTIVCQQRLRLFDGRVTIAEREDRPGLGNSRRLD